MNENEFILKLKENNIEYIKPTYFEIVNRIYKNNESYIINLSENKFGIFIAKELDFMNPTYKFMIFDDCDEFINWYYDKPLNDNTIKINNIIKNSGYNTMVYNKHIMNILLENFIEEKFDITHIPNAKFNVALLYTNLNTFEDSKIIWTKRVVTKDNIKDVYLMDLDYEELVQFETYDEFLHYLDITIKRIA